MEKVYYSTMSKSVDQLRRLLFFTLILFSLGTFNALSQDSLINSSGKVTDEQGEPIIGASILELGTTRGTQTDINGDFSLQTLPNAHYVFHISDMLRKKLKPERT